jgi:hypothetical protein
MNERRVRLGVCARKPNQAFGVNPSPRRNFAAELADLRVLDRLERDLHRSRAAWSRGLPRKDHVAVVARFALDVALRGECDPRAGTLIAK